MNTRQVAHQITAHPRMVQILDKAQQDHAAFEMWLNDMLKAAGAFSLPAGIVEALNSGDGIYRP